MWADDSSSDPHQHRLTMPGTLFPCDAGQDASWLRADPGEGSSNRGSTCSVVSGGGTSKVKRRLQEPGDRVIRRLMNTSIAPKSPLENKDK